MPRERLPYEVARTGQGFDSIRFLFRRARRLLKVSGNVTNTAGQDSAVLLSACCVTKLTLAGHVLQNAQVNGDSFGGAQVTTPTLSLSISPFFGSLRFILKRQKKFDFRSL
jgi:hypothetical protein